MSLAAYLDAAARLDPAAWQRPWAPGKWSPAQITEHLSLAYEALLGELQGGPPMRVRLTSWRLQLSRWLILPHILFHRSIPLRAAAPREMRPAALRAAQGEALRLLSDLGVRFEERLEESRRQDPRLCLTHPYFGRLDAVRGLRFVAVHLDHHRRQVEKAGG